MLKGRWREVHSDPLGLGNNDGLSGGYTGGKKVPGIRGTWVTTANLLFVCVFFNAADLGQCDYFHLRQPGGGVPQAPDGPGPQADLPGHLQLHQVAHQAGVWEIPTGIEKKGANSSSHFLSQHVFAIFKALLVSLLVELLLSLLLWLSVKMKACQIPLNYLITDPSGERTIKFRRRKAEMRRVFRPSRFRFFNGPLIQVASAEG